MVEQTIYEHLQGCTELKPFLGTFAGQMAIFNQEAPADTASEWGDSQYGRIIYAIDTKEDPDRRFGGVLMVDAVCQKGEQYPEDIEPILRAAIDGFFFTQGDMTVSAHWSSSDLFRTMADDKINGVTLTFGLLAYPKQITVAPDPISAMNAWSSNALPQILGRRIHVIGSSTLPKVFRPTADLPAIYWRISNISKCTWIPDTQAACWQTAVLQGHIMVSNHDDEGEIARIIVNTLTNKRRLITEESTFLVDRNNRISVSAGHERTGQVVIEATYGIPNIPADTEKLKNITTLMKGE